ncbi:histamine H3 receptor [Xenopus tropicalis]|uniref:Histamine H3 receptor n=1 Tax=Xenopus tropicalis TaxID=8364 RepID=A0A8J1JRD5_XENTR|nr:histamine H3 receptor [Xenopus tropicalis]
MIFYPRNASLVHLDNISVSAVSASNQSQEITDEMRLIQAVLMSCVICVTGTGNALVILGFLVNKNLRTPSNYFLLNLAIGDFLTGTVSLPLFLQNYIISGGWVLGKHVCKLLLTMDSTLCQCTIYNIVLISFDRFLAVTKAVKYQDQQKNIKLAFMKMAAVWIVAFLNFGPAIILWEYFVGYSVVPDGECYPEFYYTTNYLLYSSIFDFFTPMTAIAYFNLSIYFNIRSRMKNKTCISSVSASNLKKDDNVFVDSTINSNHVGGMKEKSTKHPSNKIEDFQIKAAYTTPVTVLSRE